MIDYVCAKCLRCLRRSLVELLHAPSSHERALQPVAEGDAWLPAEHVPGAVDIEHVHRHVELAGGK